MTAKAGPLQITDLPTDLDRHDAIEAVYGADLFAAFDAQPAALERATVADVEAVEQQADAFKIFQ